jgi:phytanoyl-CoA hydroxylase
MSVLDTGPSRLSLGSEPEAAFASYQNMGFHIEPDAWTPAECDALIAEAKKLREWHDGSLIPSMHPHRTSPLFLDALRRPSIVRMVERLAGGRVDGIQTELFYCRPGTPGFSVHQDNFYVQAPPDAFVSVWSALVDTAAANGGLYAFPGAHKEPLLPVEKVVDGPKMIGQDPNAQRVQAVVPAKYAARDLVVPRGAAVFLHAHMPHGSHDNASNVYRWVLLSTYVRRGVPFRAGEYAKRTPVNLYSD